MINSFYKSLIPSSKNFIQTFIQNNYIELVILYFGTFTGLFFMFLSPNFGFHFSSLSTTVTPFMTIYSIMKNSIFVGSFILLFLSILPFILVFIYIPVLNFGISNTDFSNAKTKSFFHSFLIFYFYIMCLVNIMVYTQGTFSFQILFFSMLCALLYFLVKREQRDRFISNNLTRENIAIIVILLILYSLFVFLAFSFIGPATDIHVDESLYLTTGRNFAYGIPSLYVTNYPTFPFILSLIIAFTQNQGTISLVLIFIHGSIVIFGYKFVKSAFRDTILALSFAFTLSISPLLLLYSVRAFFDLAGIIFILITAEAVIKRRQPFLVALLGLLLLFDKMQYLLAILFFVVLIFFPIQNDRIKNLIPSFKDKSFKEILKLIWNYNVTFENWLLRVLLSFTFIFTPFFLILKAPYLLGYSVDPNIGEIQLLDINTISDHLTQYINWASLQTIWIHNGNTLNELNNFFINQLWIFFFIIVTLYALYQTVSKRELSYYFLPLVSVLTIFFPQLVLLVLIFQRYTLNAHVLIYLLTIVLFVNLVLKGGFYLVSRVKNISIHPVLPRIKYPVSFIFSITVILLLFIPTITSIYPILSTTSSEFVRPGYRSGVDYIKNHYSIKDTLLGVDDGWRAGWYFNDYNSININYLDGWSQFYNSCFTTNSSVTKILFIDTGEYASMVATNSSYFSPLIIFQSVGIYLFNDSNNSL